jgi:hypothetical protein
MQQMIRHLREKRMADAERCHCPPGEEVTPSAQPYKKMTETATKPVPGLPCRQGSPQTAAAVVLERREWQKPEEATLQN